MWRLRPRSSSSPRLCRGMNYFWYSSGTWGSSTWELMPLLRLALGLTTQLHRPVRRLSAGSLTVERRGERV